MIEIHTFGGLVVRKGPHIVCTDLGSVTGELLTYLAIHANAVLRRERIAEMVWPEKSAARSRASLNTSIWRINDSLKAAHIQRQVAIGKVTETTITLRLGADVALDCAALSDTVGCCQRQLMREGELGGGLRAALRAALDGYQAGFLDGSDSDWVIREREKYRCLYVRGMTLLMRDYTHAGRIEEALECGRTIQEQDEFREATQRAVMWLHVMNGQRGEAIAQYRRLEQRLMDEIGVAPMAETTALYRHILGESAPPAAADPAGIAERLKAEGARRIAVFDTIVTPEIAQP